MRIWLAARKEVTCVLKQTRCGGRALPPLLLYWAQHWWRTLWLSSSWLHLCSVLSIGPGQSGVSATDEMVLHTSARSCDSDLSLHCYIYFSKFGNISCICLQKLFPWDIKDLKSWARRYCHTSCFILNCFPPSCVTRLMVLTDSRWFPPVVLMSS